MTEAEAENAIKQRWIDGWVPLHPTIRFCFDNEAFDPGADANWVRLTILPTVREQVTMGARKFDLRGVIMVSLFGSVDIGSTSLTQLADDVRTVLEGYRLTDVVTRAGSSRRSTDARWEMRTVSIPYDVEQNR